MKIKSNISVNFTVTCELTEGDLRALDALVGYGFDDFLKAFYQHMGKSYLEPYEKDLKTLFEKINAIRPELFKNR